VDGSGSCRHNVGTGGEFRDCGCARFQDLQSLARERDDWRTRAVMAENHKTLSLLGRSSEQEAREEKLRYALAEAEIRAEQAEAALATLREAREQEKGKTDGLRDVQPVLTSKPEATSERTDPVFLFIHWSKDSLIPYNGCSCVNCEAARKVP
jgi:hypothetical protein